MRCERFGSQIAQKLISVSFVLYVGVNLCCTVYANKDNNNLKSLDWQVSQKLNIRYPRRIGVFIVSIWIDVSRPMRNARSRSCDRVRTEDTTGMSMHNRCIKRQSRVDKRCTASSMVDEERLNKTKHAQTIEIQTRKMKDFKRPMKV